MKNIILILSLFLTTQLLSNELDWVDQQIKAIKPPRTGMKNREINGLKNPFIYLQKNAKDQKGKVAASANKTSVSRTASKNTRKNATKRSKVFTLSLVMNNKAMINGSWYKAGEKVNGYKVSEVKRASVLLIKNKKKLLLSTKSTSKKLNFKNK